MIEWIVSSSQSKMAAFNWHIFPSEVTSGLREMNYD